MVIPRKTASIRSYAWQQARRTTSECACLSGAGPSAVGKVCVSEGVRGDARVPYGVDAPESWAMSTSIDFESKLQREEDCVREGEGEAWERI